LRGLSQALAIFFALDGIVAIVAIVALFQRLSSLNDIDNNGFTLERLQHDQDTVDFANNAAAALGGLVLITAVLFIIWMWRAAKNNEALGRVQARLGPGWAIGGWFIPLANLVIPVLVMQDLWRGSDSSVPRGDIRWRIGSRSALVGWWWAAFILSLIRIGVGSSDRNQTLSQARTNTVLAIVGIGFTVAAAVLAILVVRKLTERQEACLRAQQAAWTDAQGGAAPPTT
jgi:hypothetical protein